MRGSGRSGEASVVQVPEIGHVGVWLGALAWHTAAVEREIAAEIEELGYGALWLGEGHNGKEVFSHSGVVLAATTRIVVATGIANIWVRDAMAMVASAGTLAEAYPGRFVLGLGVSHPPQVEPRGHLYGRPVATMRSYLDAMDASDYQGPVPAQCYPRILAALRPRMLALAAERTDGVHPYLVPVEHTVRARELLGDGKLVAPEQFVLLESDPVEARRLARQALAFYLTLPNYIENLRWLGFSDDDLTQGGSNRLIDELVAWGDDEAVRSRVKDHLVAGADHVCVQPIGRNFDDLGVDQLRRLAPALTEL